MCLLNLPSPRKRTVRSHRNFCHHMILRREADADISEPFPCDEAVLHFPVRGGIKPVSLQFFPCAVHTDSGINAKDSHILKLLSHVADMSSIQRLKGKQLLTVSQSDCPLLEIRIRLFHCHPILFRKQFLRCIQKTVFL